jgi:hypothetical protein
MKTFISVLALVFALATVNSMIALTPVFQVRA